MLTTAPRYLFLALYAAGLLVFLDQAAELVAAVLPNFTPDDPQFRFATFALIVSRTTTAVIMDMLIILAALGLQHSRMLRFWGIVHLVVAALLLVGLAFFVLDVVQLRTVVSGDAAGTLTITAIRASVMVILAVVYCVYVMIAATRAARRTSMIDKSEDEGPVLVTGS
jgi:hypothetical protein